MHLLTCDELRLDRSVGLLKLVDFALSEDLAFSCLLVVGLMTGFACVDVSFSFDDSGSLSITVDVISKLLSPASEDFRLLSETFNSVSSVSLVLPVDLNHRRVTISAYFSTILLYNYIANRIWYYSSGSYYRKRRRKVLLDFLRITTSIAGVNGLGVRSHVGLLAPDLPIPFVAGDFIILVLPKVCFI